MNVRPFTEADAPIVAEHINRDEELFYNRPGRVTADEILRYLPWNDEAWVWEDSARVVGSATFSVQGEGGSVRGVVGEKDRGIGTAILERGEKFARAKGAKKIITGAAEPDELAEERTTPELPDGLLPDDVRDGEHDDERGPMWFVVRAGDEFAAVTRNEVSAGRGYAGAIGVRPAWRGKGLAKALLYRTFAEFWRRGTTRVTLDADAQNETGAVALYERVGVHVETCGVAYEKVLA